MAESNDLAGLRSLRFQNTGMVMLFLYRHLFREVWCPFGAFASLHHSF